MKQKLTVLGTWCFILGIVDILGLVQYWQVLSGSPSVIVTGCLRGLTLLGTGSYLLKLARRFNGDR